MKQQRMERTSQLASRIFSDWRSKLLQSISGLWVSQDTNQDGSTLLLLYVIACLVAVNLILRLPNQVPFCGP